MTKWLVGILAVGVVVAASSAAVLANESSGLPGGMDNFESYPLGTIFQGSTGNWGDSNTTVGDPLRSDVVVTAPLGANPNNQAVEITDNNTANLKNTHLRTDFWPSTNPATTGTYDVTFDVQLLQTNGPFKAVLTNGPGWTSGSNWVAAIAFGSTGGNSFFTNSFNPSPLPAVNDVLFQTKTFQGVPNKRYDVWSDTGISYGANTWYSVDFTVNADAMTFNLAFGPQGGPLTSVASNLPWIQGSSTPPSSFGGIYFATSNVTGDGGQFLVDNVKVVPEPSSMLVLLTGFAGFLTSVRRKRA